MYVCRVLLCEQRLRGQVMSHNYFMYMSGRNVTRISDIYLSIRNLIEARKFVEWIMAIKGTANAPVP